MDDLTSKINDLKRARGAVILAHNYQTAEVQAVADYTGDSLGLSVEAARTGAGVIVFCGVSFMAQTAAVLCPYSAVLLPAPDAGCPMADMIDAPALRRMKAENPGAAVVCYVNSSVEVKAESDVCCTSANALRVVASFPPERPVIFVPDKYLADYVSRALGRPLIVASGYCPTHARILPEHVASLKSLYPDALVLAHPECPRAVLELADEVCSTDGMLRLARARPNRRVIVATEADMCVRLRRENPDKEFFPANDRAVCPNMKKTTLEKVLESLETGNGRVAVAPDTAALARRAIDAMLAL